MKLQALREHLEHLQEAFYSGALEVMVDGVTTKFRNGAELERAIAHAENRIRRMEGSASRRPRSAQIDLSGF